MLLITLNDNTLSLSPGSQVIFPHQTWEDYERLLSLRLQKTYPKLYFNRKTQEIRLMSPLPSQLSDLVYDQRLTIHHNTSNAKGI